MQQCFLQVNLSLVTTQSSFHCRITLSYYLKVNSYCYFHYIDLYRNVKISCYFKIQSTKEVFWFLKPDKHFLTLWMLYLFLNIATVIMLWINFQHIISHRRLVSCIRSPEHKNNRNSTTYSFSFGLYFLFEGPRCTLIIHKSHAIKFQTRSGHGCG